MQCITQTEESQGFRGSFSKFKDFSRISRFSMKVKGLLNFSKDVATLYYLMWGGRVFLFRFLVTDNNFDKWLILTMDAYIRQKPHIREDEPFSS